MASKPKPMGPTSERIREAVRVWRQRRRLQAAQIEERTRNLNWPVLSTAISKIEAGARRVDCDDLVVLAMTLDVSPVTLMMPESGAPSLPLDEPIDITPGRQATIGDAWAWFTGERSLDGTAEAEFIERNRPHRFAPPAFTGDASRNGLDAWLAIGEAVRAALQSGVDSGMLRIAFETALVAGLKARRSA
jgi:transcriptional regulator with XRE-family HTH domain